MEATARLLDLQALDTAIDRLSARARSLRSGEDLAAARAESDAAEKQLGELQLQLDELDRDGSRLEHEIDSLSRKASEEERRMYDGSVANPKELDAIRHEVENLKKRKSEREDELLVVMERRESLERASEEAGSRADELRARTENVAGESQAELSRIESELSDKTAERAGIAAEIAPDVLDLYESLRSQKKGVGAAALVDGVCKGCNEALSAVELDRVRHTEGVPRCEYCRRILVL
jgi:hypothetical protein